jgi:hypothetical protein
MDFIDDKDFFLVRKNLNIFSILILILAYTNAKVDFTNFAGVQIHLDGRNFYIALFIGYCMFIWRFFTKLPLMSGFWNDFSQYYMQSHSGKHMKSSFEKYQNTFFDKAPTLKELLETGNARLLGISMTRFDATEFRKIRLDAQFYINQPIRENNAGNNLSSAIDIKLSRFFFIKKLIIFCVRYDKFGDYLLPIVPLFINLAFFFCRSSWPGSLTALANP